LIHPRQESLPNQGEIGLLLEHTPEGKHGLLSRLDIHRHVNRGHAPLGDFNRRSVISLTSRLSASSWSFCWSCTCSVAGPSQKVGILSFVVVHTSATSVRPPMIAPSLPISVTSPFAISLISSSTVAN